VFGGWQRHTRGLDIVAVTLPGRAGRYPEPLLSTVEQIVDGLADALADELASCDRDYLLFGHSLGGLLAFELGRRIRDNGLRWPRGLIVAGAAAPDAPMPPPVHNLPRAQLLHWLDELGGLDSEVAARPDLVDTLLPALRADLAAFDTYRFEPAAPLPWPIHVLAGESDPDGAPERIDGWHRQAGGAYDLDVLPGGHFFVYDQVVAVLNLIEQHSSVSRGPR
jgi:surfactin synthase thioesterase subunit